MAAEERTAPREPEANERRDIEDEAREQDEPSEQSPLLPRQHHDAQEEETPARRSLLAFASLGSKRRRRWPSIVALILLSLMILLIIVLAFLAPSTVSQYAQQAAILTPTSVSIASFTSTGVRAHILADFSLDASRVPNKPLRSLGRVLTWLAREAESGSSDVQVSLPEYGNVVLGTARVPGIKVDLRSGHVTHVDFFTDLEPGDVDGIRRIANDWVEGRLTRLRVLGKAEVPLKSGVFSLGKQLLQHERIFANDDIPTMPKYNITRLNFRDLDHPAGEEGSKGVAADVSLAVANHYPLDFTVPPLAFSILIANCHGADEPYIPLASAQTHALHVYPRQPFHLNVTGLVQRLPIPLTQDCPGEHKSPLDLLLGKYLHSEPATLYVRGAPPPADEDEQGEEETPPWLTDLLSSITVPVSLPGRSFSHLIRNFSLTDTRFRLPSPFAEPDSPDANPLISAKVRALIALPSEMSVNLSVSHVRADTEVFYQGKKLGWLDLKKWRKANSTRLSNDDDDDSPFFPGQQGSSPSSMLVVESEVKDAPLRITDEDVFAEVVQALLFGRGGGVVLQLHANVDVKLATALGELVVRGIPAQGQVPVKTPLGPSLPGNGDSNNSTLPSLLHPRLSNLSILSTTLSSLTIGAHLAIHNPTPYSAEIPYFSLEILKNGSLLARATVENLTLKVGENEGLTVGAVYAPLELGGLPDSESDSDGGEGNGADGGQRARLIGRELLSQYLSGLNTSVTVRMHAGSVPALPKLGQALSRFAIDVPAPRLTPPAKPPGNDDPSDPTDPDDGNDDDDQPPRFIEDATMHLFSSTASFTLLSPLSHTVLLLTSINATAFYHSNPIGTILYNTPFSVPPVDSEGQGVRTPKLPVEWDLGGVGFEAVKRALGGRLRVEAFAEVGVRVGEWRERVWFRGRGIGTRVGF